MKKEDGAKEEGAVHRGHSAGKARKHFVTTAKFMLWMNLVTRATTQGRPTNAIVAVVDAEHLFL